MKKEIKLTIVHFQPLEYFPPIMNLLDFVSNYQNEINLEIISSATSENNYQFSVNNPQIKVSRIRVNNKSRSSITRLLNYMRFYIIAFFKAVKGRPDVIMYFESISAVPALFYKFLFGKHTRLYVHYHEYSTPRDIEKGMKLVKMIHKLEKKYYKKKYEWISHITQMRLEAFCRDNLLSTESKIFHVMPNFPSKNWGESKKLFFAKPYKLVYVGAFGFDTMYIKEIVEWVGAKVDEFTLDIYSNNVDKRAIDFIKFKKFPNVYLHEGVSYFELPKLLIKYHVGLILYNSSIPNSVLGLSNKMFEYLACGLDVWTSDDMLASNQYKRIHLIPKIIPVDYANLESFNYTDVLNRDGFQYEPTEYFYENIYWNLCKSIKGEDLKQYEK